MRTSEPLACRFCRFTSGDGAPGSRCPNDGSALLRRAVLEALPKDPVLGRVVGGRFAVYDVLGRGGTGTVYLAQQEPMGRAVALKVLHGQNDAEMRARFEREARIVSRLQHPAHVPIIDYGIEGAGLIYLVLEFVHGRPLRQVLEAQGPMSPRRAVDIAVQVLGLLAEAHALGLVHRDIKPSNIMITRGVLGEDQAHLLDFGFAKILYGDQAAFGDGSGSMRTRRGLILGTPLYMSPEQATGRNVGPASDLYSLGVVLYKMLSGRTPFPGRDPIAVLAAHRRQPPPPLPAAAGAPKRLAEVIARALAKQPEDRFASAAEMAEALRFSVSRHFGWTPPVGDPAPPVPVEDVGLDDSLPDPMECDGDALGPESVLAESESPISLMLDIADEPDADDASAGLSIVSAQALGGGPVIVSLADFDPYDHRGASLIVSLEDAGAHLDETPAAAGDVTAVEPVDARDALAADAPDEADEVAAIEREDAPAAEADDVTERRPAAFDDEEDRLFSLTMDDLAADEPAPRLAAPEAVAAVAALRDALAEEPEPVESTRLSPPSVPPARRRPPVAWLAAAAAIVTLSGAWTVRHLSASHGEAQVLEVPPEVTLAPEIVEVEAIPSPPEPAVVASPPEPAVVAPPPTAPPPVAAAAPPSAAAPPPRAEVAAKPPPPEAAPVVSMGGRPPAPATLQMPEF